MHPPEGQAGTSTTALTRFRLARLRFFLHLTRPTLLPAYKGSTLRGAFGNALKRVACLASDRDCADCPARAGCLYSLVFEPINAPDRQDTPRPFVIKPPLSAQAHFQPGETLHFDLVLIGKALDLIPHCVAVVEAMGRIGIGPDGGAFRLDHLASIDASGAARNVYCPPWPSLDAEQQAITAAQITASNTLEDAGAITLQFLTPLRAKFHNRLAGLPDFPLLLGSLLRRLMDLARLYQAEPLEVDYHGLMQRARQVAFTPGPLAWRDWERYSNRQGQRMKLGGLLGQVTYQGDLTEFLPYLALGEWLHVGKGATFGLGMYRVVGGTST